MTSVLLVDDDNSTVIALGVRLKGMGYRIYVAKDSSSAIATVRKTVPDVIVVDVGLPDENGFVVAERIRNLAQSAATPIIFMTASITLEMREQARRWGGKAFLVKPVDATVLATAITTALSTRNAAPSAADIG